MWYLTHLVTVHMIFSISLFLVVINTNNSLCVKWRIFRRMSQNIHNTPRRPLIDV